jgi:16S rRNA (guanine(1405)-N(7))-methyltransferase
LDLACGLNPFAIPWMGLAAGTTYLGVDIDERLAAALTRLNSSLPRGRAREGVSLTGLAHDLAGGPPPASGDLVLLLKAIPCLEQQEPGAGGRLLRSLDAPCVVASFPARSLGGRDRGMRQTYDRMLMAMVEGTGRSVERLDYPTETAYRLIRRS